MVLGIPISPPSPSSSAFIIQEIVGHMVLVGLIDTSHVGFHHSCHIAS